MAAPKGHAPYPGCETGGRPTKYTEEYIDKVADALREWIEADPKNIIFEKFCFFWGIEESRAKEFEHKSEKFSYIQNMLRLKQKFTLMEGGIEGYYKHPMAALMLSNYHGVHLKTEQKVVSTNCTTIVEDVSNKSGELVNEENEISE